jgi:hypothetical protein
VVSSRSALRGNNFTWVCWYKFIVGPILFLKRKRSIVASSPKEGKKIRLGGLGLVQLFPMGWPRQTKNTKKKRGEANPARFLASSSAFHQNPENQMEILASPEMPSQVKKDSPPRRYSSGSTPTDSVTIESPGDVNYRGDSRSSTTGL